MKKFISILFIVGLCFMWPCTALADEVDNAKFYIRYDNTVQSEDGSTHYDDAAYFPVGDVNDTDDTSKDNCDGVVSTNSAYVEGAENTITSGQVNLYDEFDATSDSIKEEFAPVYDSITTAPSNEVMAASIGNYLNADWVAQYNEGKVKVLWYVIKTEGNDIHVDGVLYFVATGETVDIETDIPDEPVINPDELDESVIYKPEVNNENKIAAQTFPKTGDSKSTLVFGISALMLIAIGTAFGVKKYML